MAPRPKFKVAESTTFEERTSYKSHEWLSSCIYGKETCEEAFFWSLLYKLPRILGDNQFIKITWLGDLDHLDTSMSDVFEHVDTRYHSKLESLSRYFDAYAKIDTEWLSAQTTKSQLDSYSVDVRSTVVGQWYSLSSSPIQLISVTSWAQVCLFRREDVPRLRTVWLRVYN